MTNPTPADVRALATEAVRLAEAATPGPWRAGRNGPISMVVSDPTKAQLRCEIETGPEGGEPDDDARLIAHAGTHYATLARALLAALDELEVLRFDAISRLRDYAMECGDEDQRATLLRAADELEMERAAAIARLEARIK